MMKEVAIVVISSVITSIIAFTWVNVEKKVSDSQLVELARLIVDTEAYREVLLDKMAKSRKFVGDQGPPGDITVLQGFVLSEIEKRTSQFVKLDRLYWISAGLDYEHPQRKGLRPEGPRNLDVLGGNNEDGASVGVAKPNGWQSWKIQEIQRP